MHDFSLVFIFLSIIIYLIGFVPYIYHVFHGRVLPHPFSWTVAFILLGINTIQLFSIEGFAGSMIFPIIRTSAVTIGACIGWYLIRRIRISRFDIFCLALAIGTIVIAAVYGVSEAVIPTIAIDMLALYPTIHKIYLNPHSEDSLIWITSMLSGSCLLLSLSTFSLMWALFWVYSMVVNLVVAIFIIYRTRYMDRWTSRVKSFCRSVFAFSHKI